MWARIVCSGYQFAERSVRYLEKVFKVINEL